MATSTDVPIYTTTISNTTTNSLDIPLSSYQNYSNLKIVMSGKTTAAAITVLKFNNTSGGTDYSYTWVGGDGSSASSNRGVNQPAIFITNVGHWNNNPCNLIININGYSKNNVSKTLISRANNGAGLGVDTTTGIWRSTAPITSVQIYLDRAEYWTVGTTISVYGIGSASIGAKATGGAIYSDTDYVYHVFGSTGAFAPTQSLTADILVVGGGGGGGIGTPNGNGGGGGFVTYMSNQSLTSGTSYTCTVGAGAAGRIYSDSSRAATGGQSSFNSITAGGGTGGTGYAGTNMAGNSGSNINGTITNYSGGNATSTNNQLLAGGGGAGAGANGLTNSDNPSVVGSVGGDGLTFDILNFIEPNTYVGGGGNGGNEGTGSNGGWGPYLGYIPTYRSRGGGGWGGGQPVSNPANAPTNGTANRGGGGGGATWDNTNPKDANAANGANGGSGIVVVRYAK